MNKKGFTLVELLAVIAILAILVIMAMPNVLEMFNNSKKNTFLTEAKMVFKQAETEIIERSMRGTLTPVISSEDETALKLDGNELNYRINIKANKVVGIKVNNSSYCVSGDKDFLNNATIDDVLSEGCDLADNSTYWYDNCTEESKDIKCKILADNEEKPSDSIDYNFDSNGTMIKYTVNAAGDDFDAVELTDNKQITNGLYYVEGDQTEGGRRVYFYRGNIDNNHIIFADFCWRIVRTVEDGSVRLVYNGIPTNGKCPGNGSKNVSIGKSAFNGSKNDNAYVGYMYGTPGSDNYEDTHKNINNSTIKVKVDNWYKDNIVPKGTATLSKIADTPYCNDRSLGVDTYNTQNVGYGQNTTLYSSINRLQSFTTIVHPQLGFDWGFANIKPTYVCAQKNDKFTVSTKYGNGALTYKVALLTADEMAFAGASALSQTVPGMWLNEGSITRTMTPGLVSGKQAGNMRIWSDGVIGVNSVAFSNSYGLDWTVRPSISLVGVNQIISGDGTPNNPYQIK